MGVVEGSASLPPGIGVPVEKPLRYDRNDNSFRRNLKENMSRQPLFWAIVEGTVIVSSPIRQTVILSQRRRIPVF
jgi:hypothetical protein